MKSLDAFAQKKLAALADKGLQRKILDTDRTRDGGILRKGRKLISFCCNDYLNFNHHPQIKRAAIKATEQYGTGAGGFTAYYRKSPVNKPAGTAAGSAERQ